MGLDPGCKAMMAGAVRHGNPEIERDSRTKVSTKTQHTPIYVNAKSFRFRVGEYRRRKNLQKYSRGIEKRFNNFLQKNTKYNDVNKKNPRKYLILAKFNLKQYELKQDELERRCFRHLRFNKLIMVQREVDRLTNFIMGDNVREQPCLVSIGTTQIAPFIKGHVKTPLKKIENRLRERSKQVGEERLKIIDTYEAFTTKICSSCNEEHIVSKSPKRYAFCKKCHVIWNRDINAGINILNIALINESILERGDIPNAKVFTGIQKMKRKGHVIQKQPQ